MRLLLRTIHPKLVMIPSKAHYFTPPAKSISNPDHPSLVAATNLIKHHCNRGALADARNVLDQIPHRDVVAWTAMISGYTSRGQCDDSWAAFKEMLADSVAPNAHTLSTVLKASRGVAGRTRAAHGVAIRRGVERTPHVGNTLLDAYAAVSVTGAVSAFKAMEERNVVAWTTMIAAYLRCGDGCASIRMFQRMIREGAEWNPYISSVVIRACAAVDDVTLGREIHAAVVKFGHETNLPVVNSLVDMYSRCGSLSEAKQYFGTIPVRDTVTWNTMIAALDRLGSPEALHLVVQMVSRSISLDVFTFTSVVSACGQLVVLNFGQQVHGTIIRRGFAPNRLIGNTLINMYTKCGCVVDSERVFMEMSHRDLVSWTSMMVGYGINGFGKEAIELFEEMIEVGIRPDTVVFTGLLSACSHSGLVDEGLKYFESMTTKYGMRPEKEVIGCVVDLLGRAGRVAEAYGVIEAIKFEPDESIWGALLGACRMHKNAELGMLAAEKIVKLKPNRAAKTYVMLSNIHAARREWGEAGDARRLMREAGSRKEAGRSWLEVRGEMQSFVSGEGRGFRVSWAHEVLGMMLLHMDEEFVPDFDVST